MQKIERVKMLLSFNNYNYIKDFVRGNAGWKSNLLLHRFFSNGKKITAEIKPNPKVSKSILLRLSLIDIHNGGNTLDTVDVYVNKISQLISVFSLTYDDTEYLISIDKDVELTVNMAKSRINIVKWNCLKFDYLRNLVIFNNFNDDFKLLETSFALVTGANHLDEIDKEFIDIIKEKFEYYGYDENNIVDLIDVENGYVPNDTLDDILNNLIGVLLKIVYQELDYINYDYYKDFAYSQVEKYLAKAKFDGIMTA